MFIYKGFSEKLTLSLLIASYCSVLCLFFSLIKKRLTHFTDFKNNFIIVYISMDGCVKKSSSVLMVNHVTLSIVPCFTHSQCLKLDGWTE